MLSEQPAKALGLESGLQPMTDVIIGRNWEINNMIINMLSNSFDDQESLSVVNFVGIGGENCYSSIQG